MYVAMIAFGSMPIVTLTISKYVQEYPDELRFKAYTLGASNTEVIFQVIFPYILPKVIDLCILMIGPALVYLIAAEQIVAGEGFGYRIRVLTKATRFEVVYPLIVILTIYAAILTFALNRLRSWLCPWYRANPS
ncbi:MAG: ABC transporter permease subunit, partial [Verrucomicrobiota bacterium]